MRIEISNNEWADRVRKFDSCGLSYVGALALAEWIETLADAIDDPDLGSDIGTWAILSHETTIADLASEHPDRLTDESTFDDVLEAIHWDFLGDCYSDAIYVDDSMLIVIGL